VHGRQVVQIGEREGRRWNLRIRAVAVREVLEEDGPVAPDGDDVLPGVVRDDGGRGAT